MKYISEKELVELLFEMKLDAVAVQDTKTGKNKKKNRLWQQARGAMKTADYIIERLELINLS